MTISCRSGNSSTGIDSRDIKRGSKESVNIVIWMKFGENRAIKIEH